MGRSVRHPASHAPHTAPHSDRSRSLASPSLASRKEAADACPRRPGTTCWSSGPRSPACRFTAGSAIRTSRRSSSPAPTAAACRRCTWPSWCRQPAPPPPDPQRKKAARGGGGLHSFPDPEKQQAGRRHRLVETWRSRLRGDCGGGLEALALQALAQQLAITAHGLGALALLARGRLLEIAA